MESGPTRSRSKLVKRPGHGRVYPQCSVDDYRGVPLNRDASARILASCWAFATRRSSYCTTWVAGSGLGGGGMAPETFAEPGDDTAFLACVDRIITGLIERHAPEDIYLVR